MTTPERSAVEAQGTRDTAVCRTTNLAPETPPASASQHPPPGALRHIPRARRALIAARGFLHAPSAPPRPPAGQAPATHSYPRQARVAHQVACDG